LPTDRDTGKPRGFAFVEFRERTDAEEAIRRLNNQVFKGRPLAVSEARARDDHVTPRAPRPAAPRPPDAAATSAGDGRDFGPERRPKRPMYKRAAGPVRFSTEDDDGDEEEERGAHGERRRADAGEHDTA
jgi:RNA recognition motif-containing protein